MPNHFRVARLSDLHLNGNDAGRRSEPKLPHQRLTGMNEAFRTVLKSQKIHDSDAILIAGDITDKGNLATWKRFDQLLRKAGVRDKTHVDIDHPDIEDYINWKVVEEQKVAALVAGSKLADKHLGDIMQACDSGEGEGRFDPRACGERAKTPQGSPRTAKAKPAGRGRGAAGTEKAKKHPSDARSDTKKAKGPANENRIPGSSPRVRGTRGKVDTPVATKWFIPARAGNAVGRSRPRT